jgi:putative flippase GtrA
MILLKDARERTRFYKFALVGTIGFGVDFGVFNLFRNLIGFPAEIWNRHWTYPESRSKPLTGQLAQFAVVNVFGLIIRTVIFILITKPLVHLFEIINLPLPFEARMLGENLALAIVVVIVMFWNFFVNRYWTYNDID